MLISLLLSGLETLNTLIIQGIKKKSNLESKLNVDTVLGDRAWEWWELCSRDWTTTRHDHQVQKGHPFGEGGQCQRSRCSRYINSTRGWPGSRVRKFAKSEVRKALLGNFVLS